jgi:hypothetical protein
VVPVAAVPVSSGAGAVVVALEETSDVSVEEAVTLSVVSAVPASVLVVTEGSSSDVEEDTVSPLVLLASVEEVSSLEVPDEEAC